MFFLKTFIDIKKLMTVVLNKFISFCSFFSSVSFNFSLFSSKLNNSFIFSELKKVYLSWNKVKGGINKLKYLRHNGQ